MQLVRYKNLSQFIDSENLYKNATLLSEVFTFGESYFLFMKRNDSNEVWMSRETFAGGFDILKIPFQTQGISVDRQELLKCYDFNLIGVNFLSFKINSNQFLTIIKSDADGVALFVDNSADILSFDFIHTSCPLTTTRVDQNWTIHGFNSRLDGTGSGMIFNTQLDWSNYLDVNPAKLADKISSTVFTSYAFNVLISDSQSTRQLQTYAMTDNIPMIYLNDIQTLNNSLLNQGSSANISLDQSSIQDYISNGLTSSMSLVYFNNNSLIFYDMDSSNYTYKNLYAHISNSFDSTYIFEGSDTRFNLFKQILKTFNGVSDVANYRLGKAIISANTFMMVESNMGIIQSAVHKMQDTYLTPSASAIDIMNGLDTESCSTIKSNYIQK